MTDQLSSLLNEAKLNHTQVLGEQVEHDARLIQQAGQPSAITIVTNLPGRGIDFLEGDQQAMQAVREAGGIHVFGVERNTSRRLDEQLRQCAGRQGEPGSSQFYMSLDGDLLQLFGSDRLINMMEKLQVNEAEPIQHRMISKTIKRAQLKVEQHDRDIRKQVQKYDDLMQQQREVFFNWRRDILSNNNTRELVLEHVSQFIEDFLNVFQRRLSRVLKQVLTRSFNVVFLDFKLDSLSGLDKKASHTRLMDHYERAYDKKVGQINKVHSGMIDKVVKTATLNILDTLWYEHLHAIDELRDSAGSRVNVQKDFYNEFKTQAFKLFNDMEDEALMRIEERLAVIVFELDLESD